AGVDGDGLFDQRGEQLVLTDARVRLPARALAPALDIPSLALHGDIDLSIVRAELVEGVPRQLQGQAVWRNAAVSGAAAAGFGELTVRFASQADGAIHGSISDNGGPLQADGNFVFRLSGYRAEVV